MSCYFKRISSLLWLVPLLLVRRWGLAYPFVSVWSWFIRTRKQPEYLRYFIFPLFCFLLLGTDVDTVSANKLDPNLEAWVPVRGPGLSRKPGPDLFQEETPTPTVDHYACDDPLTPDYVEICTPTPVPTSWAPLLMTATPGPGYDYGCPDDGSQPQGWLTKTPSSLWLLNCSQCITPTSNPDLWPTIELIPTNTPYPTPTPGPGTPTATTEPTITPTASPTPYATAAPHVYAMDWKDLYTGTAAITTTNYNYIKTTNTDFGKCYGNDDLVAVRTQIQASHDDFRIEYNGIWKKRTNGCYLDQQFSGYTSVRDTYCNGWTNSVYNGLPDLTTVYTKVMSGPQNVTIYVSSSRVQKICYGNGAPLPSPTPTAVPPIERCKVVEESSEMEQSAYEMIPEIKVSDPPDCRNYWYDDLTVAGLGTISFPSFTLCTRAITMTKAKMFGIEIDYMEIIYVLFGYWFMFKVIK